MKRYIFLGLLGLSGIGHASLLMKPSSTIYCPVPPKHMKAEYFSISEGGKLAQTSLKERSSGQITNVYIRSKQYLLDQDIIKKTINYSSNERLRTPSSMLGCNKCVYESPYGGVDFWGCIQ